MTAEDYNKTLGICYAVFAVIMLITVTQLLTGSIYGFIALAVTEKSGSGTWATVIGIVISLLFYGGFEGVFVAPTGGRVENIETPKKCPRLGMIAAIVVLPLIPLVTALGAYGLWILAADNGRQFMRPSIN